MKNSGSGSSQSVQRAFACDTALLQLRQRLGAVVRDVRRTVDWQVQSAPQRSAGFHVQLAHQRRAPPVPQIRIGGVDVGDGQRIQIVESLLRAHLAREFVDHHRIVDVLALRGCRHQQMHAHEPRHEFCVGIVDAVTATEVDDVDRAERRVISAAPLGDVVEQSCDVEQLDFRQILDAMVRNRERVLARAIVQTPHVADHHHGVRVHRVDVEQVVLHLADDAAELGYVTRQHSVPAHARQLRDQRVRCAQQIDEQAGDFGVVPERFVDQVEAVAHLADSRRPYARDVAAVGHDHEHFHQRRRMHAEHVFAARLHVVVADLEAFVDRFDFRLVVRAKDRFVEMLQQDVVHFSQAQHVAVVVVHELLDAELRLRILVAQPVGEGALIVEQQAIFRSARDEMETVADPPQESSTVVQPLSFLCGEEAARSQVVC
jgi:hypothetical protein